MYGGIGSYCDGLLNAFGKYGKGKISVAETGVSHPHKRFRPFWRLVYLSKLNLLKRKFFNGADVVHFANYYVPGRNSRTAYVATIHDLDPLIMPEVHSSRYLPYFKKVVEHAVHNSDILVTQTEAVRQDVVTYFQLDDSKVMVGGDGLSDEFMAYADRENKLHPDNPMLLYVGQINMKKNVTWLVNTVYEGVASGALPKLTLILVGGEGYGSFEFKKNLRNFEPVVQWCRGVPLDKLVSYYCQCAAVVVPSFREGFGRPLLEGMYCGKPIVASRIPSSREVAGNAAFYFDLEKKDEFYSAVRSALSAERSEERKVIAKNQLRKYSWENLTEVYYNIYQSAKEAVR